MQRDAMASIIAKDLVAASATPLILSILKNGDSYGYEIIQQVKEHSNGLLEWADGMLYPILHRMEKNDFIESYWGKADTGRKRKYYTLQDEGRKELLKMQEQWHQLYTYLCLSKENNVCLISITLLKIGVIRLSLTTFGMQIKLMN